MMVRMAPDQTILLLWTIAGQDGGPGTVFSLWSYSSASVWGQVQIPERDLELEEEDNSMPNACVSATGYFRVTCLYAQASAFALL